MALREEVEEASRQAAIQEELRVKRAVNEFGAELGHALIDYTRSPVEQRGNFARAVVTALESENHESKVTGI